MGEDHEVVDGRIVPQQEFVQVASKLKKMSPLLGMLGLFWIAIPLFCFAGFVCLLLFLFQFSLLLKKYAFPDRNIVLIFVVHFITVIVSTILLLIIRGRGTMYSDPYGILPSLMIIFNFLFVFIPLELFLIRYYHFDRVLNMKMTGREKIIGVLFPILGSFVLTLPFLVDMEFPQLSFLFGPIWEFLDSERYFSFLAFIIIVYNSQALFFYSIGKHYEKLGDRKGDRASNDHP